MVSVFNTCKEAGATQNEFTARLDDDFDKIYFVVVGSSVRDSDLIKLTAYLSQAPIRSVAMITAFALIRLVEESIRDRNRFSFVDLDKLLLEKNLSRPHMLPENLFEETTETGQRFG